MLNWISVEDRLPMAGYVLTRRKDGVKDLYHYSNVIADGPVTHWISLSDVPSPEIWRAPTIHDLAKAGKPIPCRYRDDDDEEWNEGELSAIDVNSDAIEPYFADHCWWTKCEILDA